MQITLYPGDIFWLENELHRYSGNIQDIETGSYSDFNLILPKKIEQENRKLQKSLEGSL